MNSCLYVVAVCTLILALLITLAESPSDLHLQPGSSWKPVFVPQSAWQQSKHWVTQFLGWWVSSSTFLKENWLWSKHFLGTSPFCRDFYWSLFFPVFTTVSAHFPANINHSNEKYQPQLLKAYPLRCLLYKLQKSAWGCPNICLCI